MTVEEDNPMPANNRLLVFRKSPWCGKSGSEPD
jgi:hypothetical protein